MQDAARVAKVLIRNKKEEKQNQFEHNPVLWLSLHLSAFSPTRLISHSSEHWDAVYTILCSVELTTAALASKWRFGFVRMSLLNYPTARAEMWSQSAVAKSLKFQFEHKFVLRLAQSDTAVAPTH